MLRTAAHETEVRNLDIWNREQAIPQ